MKIKTLSPKLQRVFRAAFPDYTGRRWSIRAREKVSALSYWEGGSRKWYCWVNLSSQYATPVPETNPMVRPMPEPVQIQPGMVLVENCRSGGVNVGLTIYCHADDWEGLQAGCTLASF